MSEVGFGEAELTEIEARANAATPGPWFYNGYSAVQSEPKVVTEDTWWDTRMDDGHSYDHRAGQTCEACGPRFMDVGGKQVQVWDCAHSGEAMDADCLVAHVPASYGDTATGQRCLDAEFIAHAREDIPRLVAEVRRVAAQRDADAKRHEREITDWHRHAPSHCRRLRAGAFLQVRRMSDDGIDEAELTEDFIDALDDWWWPRELTAADHARITELLEPFAAEVRRVAAQRDQTRKDNAWLSQQIVLAMQETATAEDAASTAEVERDRAVAELAALRDTISEIEEALWHGNGLDDRRVRCAMQVIRAAVPDKPEEFDGDGFSIPWEPDPPVRDKPKETES